jgi:hypothetical protein
MATLLGDVSLVEAPSGTSVAVPYPAGIRAGEKLMAFLAGPSNTVATVIPSGWTAHTSRAGNEVGANNAITVWERTATGTETGTVTMTGTGTAGRITGVIFRVADVDATTAFDVTTVVGAQTSNAAYNSPAIAPVTADALLVHVLSINSGATATITAAPAGLTQVITNPAPDNTTAGRKVYVYTEGRPTAGTTGTRSWTQSGTTQWTYIGIAFRPTATPTVPAEPTGPAGTWTSMFNDDFGNGALDTTKWTALDSWSMNGVQAMARNVSVSGGNLLLTLESASFGAAVSSDPFDSSSRYDVQVGDYVEAKVYMPGDGSIVYNWPAFWTSGQNWPTNGEHDVAEVLSKQVAINYHYGTGASPQQSGPWAQAGYWGNAWHTYGVHRKATTADVYWDGRLVRSYSTSDSGGGHTVLLNVGVSGTPVITGTASQIKVDYVKAWRPTASITSPTVASPPPAWASTTSGSSLTTAAFTPPANALLLAQSMFDTSTTTRTETTTTVTGSTSAWTKLQHQNAGFGLVDSNWATVTSSVSTTVRTTWVTATNDGALALFVITGQHATTPIGQSGKGVADASGVISFSVTPTVPGSRIFVSYANFNGGAVPTSPQLTAYGSASPSGTFASFTSAGLLGATTITLSGGGATASGAAYNWVEVVPAAAAPAGPANVQSSATDSAGAVDTVTTTLTAARAATDTAGATDSHSWSLGRVWAASSSAGAADTVTQSMAVVRSLTSAAGASDKVTWTIDRPDILDYQFVFDAEPYVPFGLGQTIVVADFNPGTAETRSQDINSPTSDARIFGTDRRTPPTWSFDLYTDVETPEAALAWAQNMEEVWDAEGLRRTPNAVVALRYKLAGRVRRVFGRPRDFSLVPSFIRTGRVHMVADFALAENTFYDDTEDGLIVRTDPTVGGQTTGFTYPVTYPLTIGGYQEQAARTEQANIYGKRPTWVDITITGPTIDPWVRIGDQRWALRGQLGNGESVRLSGKTWQQGVFRGDGAPVPGLLDPRARLSQLRIKPGSYPVSFGGYDPTGSSKATLAWRPAYGTL